MRNSGVNPESNMHTKMLAMIKLANIHLNHFPKHEKYGICQQIRNNMYDVYNLITECNKKYHKKTSLSTLDIKHEQLRMMFRNLNNSRYIKIIWGIMSKIKGHIMIYNKNVQLRGKEVEIKDLKPTSVVKIDMTCQDCGVEFKRFANRLFTSGSFLCQSCALKDKSRTYLDVGYTNNMLTVIGASKKSGKSVVRCDCGKIKEVFNRSIVSGRTKSCGCLKSDNLSKENNYNWRGGISSEDTLIRASKEYKSWKRTVLKRDNYTCKKCGTKDATLNVHHIKELTNNKDDAFDIVNGITFCESCHREFHREYGKNNLSMEMVDTFIK